MNRFGNLSEDAVTPALKVLTGQEKIWAFEDPSGRLTLIFPEVISAKEQMKILKKFIEFLECDAKSVLYGKFSGVQVKRSDVSRYLGVGSSFACVAGKVKLSADEQRKIDTVMASDNISHDDYVMFRNDKSSSFENDLSLIFRRPKNHHSTLGWAFSKALEAIKPDDVRVSYRFASDNFTGERVAIRFSEAVFNSFLKEKEPSDFAPKSGTTSKKKSGSGGRKKSGYKSEPSAT
jgi:hypothetical protein